MVFNSVFKQLTYKILKLHISVTNTTLNSKVGSTDSNWKVWRWCSCQWHNVDNKCSQKPINRFCKL